MPPCLCAYETSKRSGAIVSDRERASAERVIVILSCLQELQEVSGLTTSIAILWVKVKLILELPIS